jgi:hypothetical protein
MSKKPKYSPFKLIPDDHIFKAKKPCPYCNGEITCSATGWEGTEDGTWIASDLEIECGNEPDLDEEEAWNEWDREHGSCDHNEAWHDLHERLKTAINAKFRFDVQNILLSRSLEEPLSATEG